MSADTRRRVALACQGGGSHAAFTAGALDRLLSETDPAYDVVALTGTSGGAVCAFLAWYGLASADTEAEGRERAHELLGEVWDALATADPWSAAANRAAVWWSHTRDNGAPVPTLSPYAVPTATATARNRLRRVLERAVPPAELKLLVDAQRRERTGPRLLVGAVDVQRGTFRTFTERDVSHDALLASAAVPTLFEAAELEEHGERRYYWDGLFSQNPPVRDLLAGVDAAAKPDEVWLLRVNPQRRERIPRSLGAIGDRRNELAGNLSVNQELAVVRQVNRWLADGALAGPYKPVAVRTVDLDESALSPPRSLGPASKLDVDGRFLGELRAHGDAQAAAFLETERTRRLVRGTVDAAWNAGGPVASAYVDESFRLHAAEADHDARGWAAYAAYVDRFRAALDGLTLTVGTVVADGERAAHRWTATGRHVGRLFGAEPTGEAATVEGVQLLRVADGKLVAAWVDVDEQGFVERARADDAAETPPTAASEPPVTAEVADTAAVEAVARANAERVWGVGVEPARVVGSGHHFAGPDGGVAGVDAYAAVVGDYRRAFPDLSVTVRDVVAEGDRVVVRAAMCGTHRGTFDGIDPTGRRVEAHWTFRHAVEDGRLVETELFDDRWWLREQLDVTPVDAAERADPAG